MITNKYICVRINNDEFAFKENKIDKKNINIYIILSSINNKLITYIIR